MRAEPRHGLEVKRKTDRQITVAVAGCVAQHEGDKLLKRYQEPHGATRRPPRER